MSRCETRLVNLPKSPPELIVTGRGLAVEDGEISLPGDKSISHRLLLVAAASTKKTIIRHLNRGGAVEALVRVLRQLGVSIGHNGDITEVIPPPGGLALSSAPLNCGGSSAAARLLLGLLCGLGVRGVIDGDATLRARPMDFVVKPLRQLGMDLYYLGRPGSLPVALRGGRMRDGSVKMNVASAQAVSAVLFAAWAAQTQVEIETLALARDHTSRLFSFLGADLIETGLRVCLRPGRIEAAREFETPRDPSAASVLIMAALASRRPGGIQLNSVCLNPTRTGFFEVLRASGATVWYEDVTTLAGEATGRIVVAGMPEQFRPFEITGAAALQAIIDEAPLAAALGVLIPGDCRINDAGELTFKETNRLTTTREMLRCFGADVSVEDQSILIRGGTQLRAGVIPSFNDHRIAMTAAALACSIAGETAVTPGDCYATSFPEFLECMRAIGCDVRLSRPIS